MRAPRSLLALIGVVVSAVALVPSPATAAASTPDSAYFAVACPTAHHCVAVGYRGSSTLVRVRHAGRWTTAAAPPVPGALSAIACVGKRSCIAVGHRSGARSVGPLAEVLDGKHWRLTATPSPAGSRSVSLESVACHTRSDCWAVGSYSTDGITRHTLAEHWDGSRWTIVATADPAVRGNGNDLSSVSCLRSSECVATGTRGQGLFGSRFFAETWTGRSWVRAKTAASSGNSVAGGVACSPAAQRLCFAVGADDVTGTAQPLVERWTGRAWRLGHAAGGSGDRFSAVDCPSSARCVAVGADDRGRLFAESWRQRWSMSTIAQPSSTENGLSGVSCSSGSRCLAVGFSETASGAMSPLVERWDGSRWRLVAA